MKKIHALLLLIGFAIVGAMFMSSTGCDVSLADTQTERQKADIAQKENSKQASVTVSVPQIEFFLERQTIAKFAKYYDKPNVITYVYVMAYGRYIGYYVCDGKPASIRSYLTPEDQYIDDPNGSVDAGSLTVQAPSIDGTYGEDNPGIRFFTTGGTPIEVGGVGVNYMYSPVPLDVENCPLLLRENPKKSE